MSISERERQALDSIGNGLARSAPKLASMMAMFARLTADEDMPAREPVRCTGHGQGWRRHLRREALLWLWLATVIVLLAVSLTLSYSMRSGKCAPSRTTACGQAPAPAQPGAGRIGGR